MYENMHEHILFTLFPPTRERKHGVMNVLRGRSTSLEVQIMCYYFPCLCSQSTASCVILFKNDLISILFYSGAFIIFMVLSAASGFVDQSNSFHTSFLFYGTPAALLFCHGCDRRRREEQFPMQRKKRHSRAELFPFNPHHFQLCCRFEALLGQV